MFYWECHDLFSKVDSSVSPPVTFKDISLVYSPLGSLSSCVNFLIYFLVVLFKVNLTQPERKLRECECRLSWWPIYLPHLEQHLSHTRFLMTLDKLPDLTSLTLVS